MLKDLKKKRLKKPVKFAIAIFVTLIITGTLGFLVQMDIINAPKLVGYFTLDNEPPEENTNIAEFMINYTEHPIELGTNRWTIYQRYRLDDKRTHQYCEIDCANLCVDKELDYYRGYVQTWGKCMCKCEIPLSIE